MKNKINKELGKGIKALIRDNMASENDSSNVILSINKIIPNKKNPRKNFDKQKLEELKQSIFQHGILQPLVVRKIDKKKYELIAGGRRFEAITQLFKEHNELRFKEVPVFVRKVENEVEMTELALIENLQRSDLNPIEEALAYHELKENYNMSNEEIASRIGKSRSTVSNMIRLLSFNKTKEGKVIVDALEKFNVTVGQVRPLLDMSPNIQKALFRKIQNIGMSSRQVEREVKKYKDLGLSQIQKKSQIKDEWDEQAAIYILKLSKYLETSVSIRKNKNGIGKVIINYQSEQELAQIIKNKILK
jgi:ParB family chromosome partitioning protein